MLACLVSVVFLNPGHILGFHLCYVLPTNFVGFSISQLFYEMFLMQSADLETLLRLGRKRCKDNLLLKLYCLLREVCHVSSLTFLCDRPFSWRAW